MKLIYLIWSMKLAVSCHFWLDHLFHLILKKKKKNQVDSDRIAEYDIKLIGIHPNTLGIPETEYEVAVTTASNEFTRIVRHDLSQPGDSFRIEVNKEGIRFAGEGKAR